MENGWVKIHRKILDWEWYDDHNTTRLFIHLLLVSNHKEKNWKGITIKEGELLTGRISLAKQTGLTQQQIRTSLTKLKSTNEITIKSTSKYSVICIIKWSDYQLKENKLTSKSTSKPPYEQPASNHKQECKNDKKIRRGTPYLFTFKDGTIGREKYGKWIDEYSGATLEGDYLQELKAAGYKIT